jgi:hypothetical protein
MSYGGSLVLHCDGEDLFTFLFPERSPFPGPPLEEACEEDLLNFDGEEFWIDDGLLRTAKIVAAAAEADGWVVVAGHRHLCPVCAAVWARLGCDALWKAADRG